MAFTSGSKANICQTFDCIIIHSHEYLIKLTGTSCWNCEYVTRNKNLLPPPPADGSLSLWCLRAEHLSPFSVLKWRNRFLSFKHKELFQQEHGLSDGENLLNVYSPCIRTVPASSMYWILARDHSLESNKQSDNGWQVYCTSNCCFTQTNILKVLFLVWIAPMLSFTFY